MTAHSLTNEQRLMGALQTILAGPPSGMDKNDVAGWAGWIAHQALARCNLPVEPTGCTDCLAVPNAGGSILHKPGCSAEYFREPTGNDLAWAAEKVDTSAIIEPYAPYCTCPELPLSCPFHGERATARTDEPKVPHGDIRDQAAAGYEPYIDPAQLGYKR